MSARYKILLSGLLLIILISTPSFAEDYIDRVVAAVNDDVITLSELEKAGFQYFENIKAKAPAGQKSRALEAARGEILSLLINNIIVKQKAAELAISVEEEEIDSAIAQIISRNKVTDEEFEKELAARNVSLQEYREELRGQVLQSKLINYQVRSRIVVLEEDIKEYYEREYTEEEGESGYYILQMGFKWGDSGKGSDTKEEARIKVEKMRDRVLAGESFNELAQANSDLPSAVDGGNIGVIRKDEMAAYMRDAVLTMNPGEISKIVESDNTFQFFKLISVREGGLVARAPYDDVKDEIRDILYREEMEKQYKEWVQGLRKEAYIKILL